MSYDHYVPKVSNLGGKSFYIGFYCFSVTFCGYINSQHSMYEVILAVVVVARESQYEPDIIDRETRAGFRSQAIDDFVCRKMERKWFWSPALLASPIDSSTKVSF
jgi:hypothetical protein